MHCPLPLRLSLTCFAPSCACCAQSWGGTEKKAPPRAGAGKPAPPPAAASPAKAAAAKGEGAGAEATTVLLNTGARLLDPCVLQEATVQEAGFTTRSCALLFSGRALYVHGWMAAVVACCATVYVDR